MVTALRNKINQVFDFRVGEEKLFIWAFLYFFSLLTAYFIIRPVRENMGILGGVDDLPWLFTGTFITMLIFSPVFAWAVSRFPKHIFLPAVYGFFILNILGFWVLFSFEQTLAWGARAFFVWTSVFNLFVVSVFWSFMVNIFTKEQGKRLFGIISAGGTLGTLVGSGVAVYFAQIVETKNLMFFSAAFLAVSLVCIFNLLPAAKPKPSHKTKSLSDVIGGKFYAGFKDTLSNPYLLGISGFIALFSVTSTVLYFQQAEIISNLFETLEERTQVFASINLAVSTLTLLIQVFFTGRFVKNFGISPTIMFLPIVTFLGFILFSFMPSLAILVAFQVIRRTANFAITRPGREMLFSIVTDEQKYKAKNVIDTVVYRGGDAFSGWLYTGLSSGLGLTISAIATIAAPLALLWAGLGWLLGKRYAGTKTGQEKLAKETP